MLNSHSSVFLAVTSSFFLSVPSVAWAQHTGGSFGGTNWGSGSSSSSSSSSSRSSSSSSSSSRASSSRSSASSGSTSSSSSSPFASPGSSFDDDDDNDDSAAEAERERQEAIARQARCVAAGNQVVGLERQSRTLLTQACGNLETSISTWSTQLSGKTSQLQEADENVDLPQLNQLLSELSTLQAASQATIRTAHDAAEALIRNSNTSRSLFSAYPTCVARAHAVVQISNATQARRCERQLSGFAELVTTTRSRAASLQERMTIRLNTLRPHHGNGFSQPALICNRIANYAANRDRIDACSQWTQTLQVRADLIALCDAHTTADGLNGCLATMQQQANRLPAQETGEFCNRVRARSRARDGSYIDACAQAVAEARFQHVPGGLVACASLFEGQSTFTRDEPVHECLRILSAPYFEPGDVEYCSQDHTGAATGLQCLRVAGRLFSGNRTIGACGVQSSDGRSFGQCLLTQARSSVADQLARAGALSGNGLSP